MSGKRQTQKRLEIRRRREQVAELYIKRHSQADIAKQLGVTQQTISLDIKALHKEWADRSTDNLERAKMAELARIDALEREYWQAWEQSKQTRKSTNAEQVQNGRQVARTKTSLKNEDREGNPAFLAGVQWCITERCKILGLNAPVVSEVNGSMTWREAVLQAWKETDAPAVD